MGRGMARHRRSRSMRFPLDRLAWRQRVMALSGLLCVALGVAMLLTWLVRPERLMSLHSGFSPMKFNTALGFVLSGAALLLIERPRWSVWLARLVALLG